MLVDLNLSKIRKLKTTFFLEAVLLLKRRSNPAHKKTASIQVRDRNLKLLLIEYRVWLTL